MIWKSGCKSWNFLLENNMIYTVIKESQLSGNAVISFYTLNEAEAYIKGRLGRYRILTVPLPR